ncbi:MAG: HD domain-containing phosphohydrolase [Planctomycetota bacterium]
MNHKILIVDDEPAVREMMVTFLTKSGYETFVAESGTEAIRQIKNKVFSLVLCDVVMPASPIDIGGPAMDGLQVLAEIKRINPALPVLMMSGVTTHDLVIKSLEKGAVDFIAKPISLVQVNKIIKKVLNPDLRIPLEYPSPVARLMREGYFGILKTTNQMLEMKNPYLKGHSQRVADAAVKIARGLKLPDNTIEVINYAALLHDIGKVGISDVILFKPDKLTAQEWADIKTHPILSRMMVEQLRLFRAEEPIIEYHHEWYDGSGYPKGLSHEEIPLGARVISIADAYDAMTSDRPYRVSLDKINAEKVLRKYSGTQFDPKMVEVFLEVI